jgi:amino acid transporter
MNDSQIPNTLYIFFSYHVDNIVLKGPEFGYGNRIMEKQKSNWWIDAILFAIFWISLFPDLTGLEIHQWLGLAAMALALLHLLVHWKWVETVTLRLFSRTPAQTRIHYLMDLGVMLGFAMILLTGLLISTWLDLPLYDLAAWTHIHLMVSVFTLLLVVLKLILHWRWISNAVRRHVFDPVFIRNDSVRSVPVDRRDFLKLTGFLGAATVLTVHGLFDQPAEGQAQSTSESAAEEINPQPAETAAASTQPAVSAAEGAAADTPAPVLPAATAEPACVVRCPNGCSYPGRCRRYVDLNGNNLCDNGECL